MPAVRAGSFLETSRIAEVLRAETVGGLLLIARRGRRAGVGQHALVAAPTPPARLARSAPRRCTSTSASARWAADGLLAIFFFVAGLELKREFVAGDLRDPRRAALPVAAAVGGMVVPALVYVARERRSSGDLRGWAIPTATDIAFAVAVLAVISSHLPSGLRTFLLTLAVVDDLLAITVIAFFYTDELHPPTCCSPCCRWRAFALVAQRRSHTAYLLLPLACATWVLVHASGRARDRGRACCSASRCRSAGAVTDRGHGLAEHLEHLVRPISAGVAVPVFAFFAAGRHGRRPRAGWARPCATRSRSGSSPGWCVGKAVGVAGVDVAVARFTRAEPGRRAGLGGRVRHGAARPGSASRCRC